MDLLQKIDIKAANSGQNKVGNQARQGPSASEQSADNKPFKEQLNDQVDQLKSESNKEKNKDNQLDSESQVKQARNNTKVPEDTDSAETELHRGGGEAASNAVNTILPGDEHPAQLDAITAHIIAADLPVIGSELPVLESSLGEVDIQGLAQEIAIPASIVSGSAATTNQPPVSQVEASLQSKRDLTNRDAEQLTRQSIQLKTPEITATSKSVNVATNVAVNLSERFNITDAKFTKMPSEMSGVDIISQASRMQQVPVATTVSLNSLPTQKISAGLLTDVSASLNNLTPLSTAPQNLTPLSSSPVSTLSLSIGESLQNSNWSQHLTQQVSYMVRGGIQQAEVRLNPAHLGPMEIKLSINDDQATVNFVTQHAPVRDAVDAALPRLKEMLEQQGLNLAGADVSTQSEQKQAEQNQDEQHQPGAELQVASLTEASGDENANGIMRHNMELKSGVSIFA